METVKVKILEPKAKRLLIELENLKLIEIESGKMGKMARRRFGSMKGLIDHVADDRSAVNEFKEIG
ncbi:MAG: hypothetical protein IT173_09305 [Acidobacteria bacterium]|nr:hypothetical protein [Acidobacteriota bacterium]